MNLIIKEQLKDTDGMNLKTLSGAPVINYYFFCPICSEDKIIKNQIKSSMGDSRLDKDSMYKCSSYLMSVFKDDKMLWLSNMISHYRHCHITWYDKANNNPYYLKDYNHDEAKQEQNERTKRQIIRKCRKLLLENGITDKHFKQLRNTDKKTIELAEKYLKIKEVKL